MHCLLMKPLQHEIKKSLSFPSISLFMQNFIFLESVLFYTIFSFQNQVMRKKFSDAGIQDISMSISINMIIQKNLNDLTERCESDDQSDKHLEARDRRYSCLMYFEMCNTVGNTKVYSVENEK